MKDENVYRKNDKGRYIAYGVCCQKDIMPDGIWYVRHYGEGRSVTSVPYLEGLYKIGESKEIDLTEICGMEDLADYIIKSQEFTDMMNTGHTLHDVVSLCVKKLVEKAKEQKENEKL